MSFSRSYQSYSFTQQSGVFAEETVSISSSSRVSSSTANGVSSSSHHQSSRAFVSYSSGTPAINGNAAAHVSITEDTRQQPEKLIEQYVVVRDFTPKATDVGSIILREGQIVEVIDSESDTERWLVRTRPSKYLSPRQGWIPISYLEKKSTDTNYISILEDDYEIRSDSKEREAAQKRRNVVKELVETEEEFVSDMQHVVHTYLREMDNPRMPKELRDYKDDIFLNFKEICDFHNNVLIKGVQYYAGEPTKLGKTFLRLERDFDMHANYCQQEPQAQQLLSTLPVKEYFEEYSKRIGEIDRSLSDHLKLPIQRINDYQLLLKELIKYTARLKEDCTDLQKALDLMQGIPQRANDLKLTNSILGFKGNIHKLGRLLRHQDWFTITDSSGRSKERYLFLFKSRIFVTKVRRLSEDKSSYILKDIIKLPDIEVIDTGNERQFEVHLKGNAETIGSSRYPLIFEAQSDDVKEAWFKELGDVKRDIVVITDISEEGIIEDLTEDRSSDDVLDEEIVEPVVEVREEPIEKFAQQIISDEALIEEILVKEIVKDSRKRSIDEEQEVELAIREEEVVEKRPKVEILENFEAYEELNTVMTDSIKSGSATPLDANEFEDGTTRPRFHKSLRGQTCLRGDTVTLECEPHAIPPATIAWLKDNVSLSQSSKIQFVNKGNSQYLVIKDTKNEDSGVYSCKATNKNGTATCSAQLNILGPEEIKSNPSTPEPKKPQFTITFKDTELLEGTSVRFLVKVRANPDSDIKFFKNDKPLKEDSRIKILAEDKGTYELSIAHVTANDAGKYTCKAKNNLGESEFSAVVKVTAEKDLFPGVQEHVQNGGITHPGENTDFKWFRDGLECEASERFKVLFRDEEDTLALVFQHVKPEDAGLYTCVASTTSGRISCSAELSVEGSVSQLMRDPEPPKITAELADVEVNQGTSAMLELKVTGYPKPAITWSKDGSEIKASSKYKVLHEDDENMALIIKNVASEDAGKYSVKAKNALGEVASSAKVVVKSPPKFRKTLKDTAVMAEETIRFDVEIEGEPTPEVTWYKDGQLIKDSERIKITESAKSQTYSFEIKKSRTEDAGNYSCVASNSSGKISEFAHVTVNEAANFLRELKSIEVRESDTVKFEVKVAGQPEPSVKWRKGSVEIKEDGKHYKTEKDDRNYSLIIDKVTRDEADKYSCVITNEFGSATSTGELTINSVPQYVEKLSDMTVKEGETDYKLRVKVSGYPEPKIRWFIESMEIDERSNKYKISDEGETKVLIIKKVEAESSGTYSCTITNSNGEASCQGFLNVLTKPKFVEVLKDFEKTEQEDVSLTVKVTGNPAPNLKWYKNNEEVHESATIKVSKVVEGCNTLDLKSLVEEAAGTYECHATNSEGEAVTVSKLIVNTHPRFTGKMESVEVWSGEDALIECHGISIPYPEVKWFKNGEPLEEDKRIKIVSDGPKHQLIIANTVTEDTGVFKIEMSNKLGKAELEGGLNVKASTEAKVPVVLKKLDDVICIMGDNASYQAKIYSNPEPEIKWYKDGQEIIANDRFIMHNNNITHIFDLTLKNVTPSDIGKYTIVAENANGKVSSEASLDVHIPPVIQEIKDKKAMPDSAISFETKVTGKPRPSVKWVKGEKDLIAGGNVEIESDDVAGVYKLTLKNLAPEDSGAYACVAENVAAVAKQPFNLNVTTEAPHFIKGLQNKGCKLNTQLKADVQVYGLPMPSVKWLKDKVELSDNSKLKLIQSDERNFSLVIEQFTEDDAGNYTCKAINQAGEAVSHAQFTLHHGLPEFLKQLPKEVCVMDGEALALEAKVDINPMPAIKWLKDGKEIVPDEHIKTETLPDGTVKLSIDNAVPEDKGKYTLVAINDAGQTASTGHVVVEAMPKAPSFLKNLENQEVPLGSTLKLMAKVTAYPKPTHKWLKDGKPVKVDGRTKLVEHNGHLGLEIEDAKPEDEGKYTLQVSNHRGDASSSCQVTTKSATSAPEILQPLKPVSAIDGTPCRLEAKVGGTPLPTCNWFKDGVPLTPDDKRVKSVVRPDGTVALLFDKCAPGDAGKYTLEAVNPYGSNKCDSDLSVAERDKSDVAKKAPSFTLPLRDLELDEGKPIKLVAQIDGNPYPDISWTKDGEPLKTGDNLSLSCDGNKICLEVRKSSPKDSGKYECKLSNPDGYANSKCGVNVRKLYSPPVFTQKPTDLFTIPGGDPRFVCRVGGTPKPDVTWFYNDQPLHDSPKYKIRRDGDLCALQIKGVTLDDKGRYKCRISNDAGEDHAFANLDIGDSGDRKDKAEAPSFLKKLGDCSIMEGMSAKFTACVAGFPEPEYKWLFNNRELKDTDRIKIQVEPHGLLRLLIKNSKPEDVGSYTLKIWNPHGEIESTARLIFDRSVVSAVANSTSSTQSSTSLQSSSRYSSEVASSVRVSGSYVSSSKYSSSVSSTASRRVSSTGSAIASTASRKYSSVK